MAIFTRILEYGFTEPRYFVLIIALWLTSVVLYFIFIPRSTIKFVPMSLFIFGLLALVFPYINAFSTAKRSQKNELMKTLTENNLLQNGTINFNKKVNNKVVIDVSDKFEFLAKRHEEQLLQSLVKSPLQKRLATHIEKGAFYNISGSLRDEFKNITYDNSSINPESTPQNRTLTVRNNNINITGYQYLFKAYNYRQNSFNVEGKTIEFNLDGNQDHSKFILVYDGQKFDLLPEITEIFKRYPGVGETNVSSLDITRKIGDYEIKVIFDNLVQLNTKEKKNEFSTYSESVLILVKKN